MTQSRSDARLWRIKFVHTVIWAVLAGAIVLIPVAVFFGARGLAVWLSGLVWIETIVLVIYGWRCPLTGIARRYTDSASDNFDIFLPAWIARNNKLIFGTLFALAELYLLGDWMWG